MNSRLPWDDLQLILAVAEAGSLSGAGRKLRLSHTTVFRRLGAIEQRLGVRLFDRARSGYAPTPAGEEAAEAARRVEAEVLGLEQRVAGRDLRPSGSLRVTTTDSLLFGLLSSILRDFRAAYPEILLEITSSNTVLNLSRREADVALRPGRASPDSLVGRKIAMIAQAVYCPAKSANAKGERLDWIGPEGAMAYRALDSWMSELGHDQSCRLRIDSVLGIYAAVRNGGGRAVLPCYLGEADLGLARVGDPIPALATDLWLLTHGALRNTGRVRAFMGFVADAVVARRDLLAGTTGPGLRSPLT